MYSRIKAMLRYFNGAGPFRVVPAVVATAVLLLLLWWPCPPGLDPNAWTLVAIFLTTIVAIILKVMPIGVMAMMAIVIVAVRYDRVKLPAERADRAAQRPAQPLSAAAG